EDQRVELADVTLVVPLEAFYLQAMVCVLQSLAGCLVSRYRVVIELQEIVQPFQYLRHGGQRRRRPLPASALQMSSGVASMVGSRVRPVSGRRPAEYRQYPQHRRPRQRARGSQAGQMHVT